MTRTIDEAFAAVKTDPPPHAMARILAPVADAMVADAGDSYEDRAKTVTGSLDGEVASILEVGCGVGGLLPHFDDRFETVVGIDRHFDRVWFARRRSDASLVVGDATALPFGGAFDACVSLGVVTAYLHGEAAGRAFASIFDALAPGGQLVIDAPTEPASVLTDPWTGAGDRYQLHRSVGAGEVGRTTAEMAVEYELTDTTAGKTVETTNHQVVRLYDTGELSDLLSTAGFTNVSVTPMGRDGSVLLATAAKPS